MNPRSTFFHYKKGTTLLHKMPPVIKLVVMLLLSIGAFYVPVIPACILYFVILVLTKAYFKFSAGEIFSDSKPAIVYVIMLYLVCLVSNIVYVIKNGFLEGSFGFYLLQLFQPDDKFLSMAIHLCLSLAITSVFFRTTTILQFSDGFWQIEKFFTNGKSSVVSTTLSLTITFIPRIAAFWNRLCFAWKSRGGKEGVIKIKKLTPALFKTSMNEAYQKSLARMNRM